MEKITQFDLTAKQLKYKDILNHEFLELEVYAISDADPNRNGSHFTYESLVKAVENGSFKNKPIVGYFQADDFVSHEGEAGWDPELKQEYWDVSKGERILGWIRESDPVELVEKDGLHWIRFRCILCITYCYAQVKRLLKDRRKKISVEITVDDGTERDDGIYDINAFTLNGTTILGSRNGKPVMEGIEGAHATVLALMDDENYADQRKELSFAYQKIDGNALEDIKSEENPPLDDNSRKEEFAKMEENTMNVDAVVTPEPVVEPVVETEPAAAEAFENNDCGEPAAVANECPDEDPASLEMGCGESQAEEHPEGDPEEPHGDEGDEGCGCDDHIDEACNAKIAELEEKCAEYCGTIARMEAEAAEQSTKYDEMSAKYEEMTAKYEAEVAKYADYESIKSRMEAAEAQVQVYFCNGLKAAAVELMANEKINQTDYDAIIEKCEKGMYEDTEAIKREVAYAVYNARPAETKRFSVEITAPETNSDKQSAPMTHEERIAAILSKRKK